MQLILKIEEIKLKEEQKNKDKLTDIAQKLEVFFNTS